MDELDIFYEIRKACAKFFVERSKQPNAVFLGVEEWDALNYRLQYNYTCLEIGEDGGLFVEGRRIFRMDEKNFLFVTHIESKSPLRRSDTRVIVDVGGFRKVVEIDILRDHITVAVPTLLRRASKEQASSTGGEESFVEMVFNYSHHEFGTAVYTA